MSVSACVFVSGFCVCSCVYMCMYMCVYVYMCSCVYMCICVYVFVCVYVYICVYVWLLPTCVLLFNIALASLLIYNLSMTNTSMPKAHGKIMLRKKYTVQNEWKFASHSTVAICNLGFHTTLDGIQALQGATESNLKALLTVLRRIVISMLNCVIPMQHCSTYLQ